MYDILAQTVVKLRALRLFYETVGAICKRDDRQLQTAVLMSADGFVIEREEIGKIANIPN